MTTITGSDIHEGMKLKGKGGAFEVTNLMPFGRIGLGRRTGKPSASGFDPIVRMWEQNKSDILAGINAGDIQIIEA